MLNFRGDGSLKINIFYGGKERGGRGRGRKGLLVTESIIKEGGEKEIRQKQTLTKIYPTTLPAQSKSDG